MVPYSLVLLWSSSLLPPSPGGGCIKGLTWGLAHQYLQREKITLNEKGRSERNGASALETLHVNNSDPGGLANRGEAGRAND